MHLILILSMVILKFERKEKRTFLSGRLGMVAVDFLVSIFDFDSCRPYSREKKPHFLLWLPEYTARWSWLVFIFLFA